MVFKLKEQMDDYETAISVLEYNQDDELIKDYTYDGNGTLISEGIY